MKTTEAEEAMHATNGVKSRKLSVRKNQSDQSL